MEIKTKLMNQFAKIIDVYYEKKGGNNFLCIATNSTKLRDVEILTRAVSNFLDEINYSDNRYYLNVFSSGATLDEKELQWLSEE